MIIKMIKSINFSTFILYLKKFVNLQVAEDLENPIKIEIDPKIYVSSKI